MMEAAKLPREKFVWRDLGLHLGRSRKPVLTLVPDRTYPHLYRIKYPNGWTSSAANISAARAMLRMDTPAICWGRKARQRGFYSPEDKIGEAA